jgi:hypothetical protein
MADAECTDHNDRRHRAAERVTAERRFVAVSPASPARPSVEVMGAMDAAADLTAGGVRRDADALVIALFRAEAARLVQLARWFVDDRTAAEDLVQEAFLRLARSQHRIHDQDRAAAYLRSIVINLARDHNRRGLVSLRHRLPADPDARSAEDHAAADESRREVIAALRALPRRQNFGEAQTFSFTSSISRRVAGER